MADNYLEKRQEEYRAKAAAGNTRKSASIAQLLKRCAAASCDKSYRVRKDQLQRLIDSAMLIEGAGNAFAFEMMMEECNAAIIITATDVPSPEKNILLGRIIQAITLQAAEIGLCAKASYAEHTTIEVGKAV